MYRKTCILCQRTSLKRWFGNRTMTSNCDVANSAQQIQMTILCHWMNPPIKFFCVRHCSVWPLKQTNGNPKFPKPHRPNVPLQCDQCCHSVVNKTPRIYLGKTPDSNKKPQTCRTFKKSQNRTWNARYRYLHIKLNEICIFASYF